MSEIVPPFQRAEPIDDLDGGLDISANVLLERVWHFFISMRTGLALILALALLALVGTLLAQVPPDVQADREAYASWLDAVRPKYGGWTTIFDTLGFFAIFGSIWFKGATALLMTSIVACSVNRAPLLWRQATRPRLRMAQSFFDRAPLNAAIDAGDDEEALRVVQGAFRARHYRTVVERDADGIHLFADRFRWAPFGTVMAHLSLVLVLVGVVLGTSFGFRNSDFAVPIGTKVDVGYGTGLQIEATSFSDSYNAEDGAPSDYASQVALFRGGQQVAAQTIHVNQPLRFGDISFYQSFFGPAAAIQVKDAGGKTMYDAGVPLLYGSNDGAQRVGQFSLPQQNLTVYVVGTASGKVSDQIKAGQMQVEVYRDGSTAPVDIKVLDQGKAAAVAGLEFTFRREQQFTGLIVAKDPGVMFVWGGAIVLMLGVCLVFFFPNRRAWALIRRREDGSASVRVGAIVRHDVTFESDFGAFVDSLRPALRGRGVS